MFHFLRKKRFWAVLALLIILVIALRISADSRSDITAVEKVLRDFFSPLQVGVANIKDRSSQFQLNLSSHDELEARFLEQQQENDRLLLQVQRLSEAEQESRRLRELLGLSEAYGEKFTMVAARVIGRSPSNWYQMLTIDKGAADGIATDMAVIAPHGLVGRIGGVSLHSAQVWLLSDREVAVGVLVQETRDTQGIVEGVGDNNYLRMSNIPYYAEIETEQKVFTSGLSDIYPKGIFVGTIAEIRLESNGYLLNAEITPAVSFDKLEEVLIITEVKVVEEWPENSE